MENFFPLGILIVSIGLKVQGEVNVNGTLVTEESYFFVNFSRCFNSAICSSSINGNCTVYIGENGESLTSENPFLSEINSTIDLPRFTLNAVYFYNAIFMNDSIFESGGNFTAIEYDARLSPGYIVLIAFGSSLLFVSIIIHIIFASCFFLFVTSDPEFYGTSKRRCCFCLDYIRDVFLTCNHHCCRTCLAHLWLSSSLIGIFSICWWVVSGSTIALQSDTCDIEWQSRRDSYILVAFSSSYISFNLLFLLLLIICCYVKHKTSKQKRYSMNNDSTLPDEECESSLMQCLSPRLIMQCEQPRSMVQEMPEMLEMPEISQSQCSERSNIAMESTTSTSFSFVREQEIIEARTEDNNEENEQEQELKAQKEDYDDENIDKEELSYDDRSILEHVERVERQMSGNNPSENKDTVEVPHQSSSPLQYDSELGFHYHDIKFYCKECGKFVEEPSSPLSYMKNRTQPNLCSVCLYRTCLPLQQDIGEYLSDMVNTDGTTLTKDYPTLTCELNIEDNLFIVHEYLLDAKVRWYCIGMGLKVKVEDLDAVAATKANMDDRLLEMIKIWLQKGTNKTWQTVIAALETKAVGRLDVAEKIKENLRKTN